MKTGNKIVSLLLACSMLAASFAGTTAFAASDKPTPVEGEIETGAGHGLFPFRHGYVLNVGRCREAEDAFQSGQICAGGITRRL